MIDKRICFLIDNLTQRGRTIRLHWIKAHASIEQNEALDAAAKKEARNFRRESLFEEKPQFPGEFTLQGRLVENRHEIEYPEWRPDLDKSVMSVARSFSARRVMAGVEQWRGLKSNWANKVKLKGECVYCKERHILAFSYFLQKCPACKEFRTRIQSLWADVEWEDDLLEGCVSHDIMRNMVSNAGGRENALRVRLWDKALSELCRKLKGRKSTT